MAEKEVVILEIDVNKSQAENELKVVQQRIKELKELDRDLTNKETVELKRLQTEQKNLIKIVGSADGSYDKLSATYARNKAVLNSLSKEQRENANIGGKLIEQSRQIYEQMNEMQKATGKYVLQVGNYELAGKSLKEELRELTEQLQQMRLRGEENTKEYADLIARAGELKDTMGDVAQAINKTASDTSNLDAILGAASAATGGFGLAISAMSILGKDTTNLEKAQKKLQEAIALVNSVQAIANALNKDSALMTKLRAVAQKLLNKTMEEGAVATNAATAATNKYKIALTTAGIGLFIVALGALVAAYSTYIDNLKEATKRQLEHRQALRETDETLKDNLKDANKFSTSVAKGFEAIGKKLKEGKQAIERWGESADKQLKRAKGLTEQYAFATSVAKKNYEEAQKSALDANSEYKKLAEEYNRQTEKGILVSDGLLKRLEQLKKNRDEANQSLTEAETKYNEAIDKEQANLLTILDLEKKISTERKRRREADRAEMLSQQSSLLGLQTGFLSGGDFRSAYAQSQKLLSEQLSIDVESERDRYKKAIDDSESDIKLSNAEKKRQLQIHNKNLEVIHLNYLKSLQELDDNYNAALNEKELTYLNDLNAAKLILAQGNIDAQAQLQKEGLARQYKAAIDNAKQIGKDTTALEKAWKKDELLIDMQAADAKMGIAQSFVGNMATVFEELFSKNKEMQIATITASTIADSAKAFTTTMAQGGEFALPLAISAAAAVVAKGVAAIRQLSSTDIGSKEVSTASVGSRTTSNVNDTIIQRTANYTTKSDTPQSVLVVDEVTAKQMQISNAQKIAVQ